MDKDSLLIWESYNKSTTFRIQDKTDVELYLDEKPPKFRVYVYGSDGKTYKVDGEFINKRGFKPSHIDAWEVDPGHRSLSNEEQQAVVNYVLKSDMWKNSLRAAVTDYRFNK